MLKGGLVSGGGGDSKKGKKERRKIGGLVEWENRKKGKWRAKQKKYLKKEEMLFSVGVCVFGDRLDLEVVKGERVEDEQLTSGDRRAVKKKGRKMGGRIK